MTQKEKLIYDYLDKQNMNCSLSGYRFLVTCISFVLEHPDASVNEFLAYAASYHNTSSKKVRSAIRYALESRQCVSGTITTKEFVHSAALVVKGALPID